MRESKVHVYIIHSLKTLRKMTILFLIFPKASRGAVCLLLLDDSLQDTGINVCGKKIIILGKNTTCVTAHPPGQNLSIGSKIILKEMNNAIQN